MNIAALQQAIQADKFITAEQKLQVLDKIRQFPTTSKGSSGFVGGGIGLAVARYLALSKSAQALLAIAGYGIGRVLWEHYYGEKNNNKFMQFNDRIKAYEIQSR